MNSNTSKNKAAIVTGAAQGLGKSISIRLMNSGYDVFGFDIVDSEKVEPDYLTRLSKYIEADLSDIPSFINAVDSLFSEIIKVDVLINNAAVRSFGQFVNFTQKSIVDVVNVNYVAPILLANICLKNMRQYDSGKILNIASNSGFYGYNSGALYCSTKSALMIFSESVADELRISNSKVSILCISPDSFKTREGKEEKDYAVVNAQIMKYIDTFLDGDKIYPIKFAGSKLKALKNIAFSVKRALKIF